MGYARQGGSGVYAQSALNLNGDDEDPDPLDRMNPIPTEALPSRGGWRAILQ
jgi:hypothetical protein